MWFKILVQLDVIKTCIVSESDSSSFRHLYTSITQPPLNGLGQKSSKICIVLCFFVVCRWNKPIYLVLLNYQIIHVFFSYYHFSFLRTFFICEIRVFNNIFVCVPLKIKGFCFDFIFCSIYLAGVDYWHIEFDTCKLV